MHLKSTDVLRYSHFGSISFDFSSRNFSRLIPNRSVGSTALNRCTEVWARTKMSKTRWTSWYCRDCRLMMSASLRMMGTNGSNFLRAKRRKFHENHFNFTIKSTHHPRSLDCRTRWRHSCVCRNIRRSATRHSSRRHCTMKWICMDIAWSLSANTLGSLELCSF